MNFESTCINSEHKDLIHDVAFDHYGRRMATCSSDQFVKVWDKNDVSNKWKQTAEWKAHSGSVWKVAWAHPEFGQVLATCSFDRTAAVWEEIVGEGYGIIGQKHWARRTNLVDSRTSVMDVKFAPKTLGLLLATCSTDGMIRIYEAPDVMNLAQWTLQQEIMACKCQASCISWNPSYTREWRYTKYSKISNEKKDGEEYNQEGASTSSGSSTNNSSQIKEVETYIVIPQVPMLAVGSDDTSSGSSRMVVLQYFSKHRRWHKIDPSPVISDPVHDLAFAPRLGRSYDLLAIATKGIKIFTLSQVVVKQKGHSAMKYEINQLTDCFDDHHSIVWRVSWNSVGSILASSDDDGRLRLWKQNIKVVRQRRGLHSGRPKEVAGVYPGKPGTSSAEDETDKTKIENTQEKEVSWKCVSVIGGDGRVITPVIG